MIIQDLTRPAHLYFCDFVSAKRLSCGREARVLRGKSIGGTRNPPGDPALLPQNVAGLSGVTQFGIRNSYFFFSIPHSAIGIPHLNCPPDPENEVRLMVFSRNALASWPGNG